jgi:hypothetical protein
MVFLQWNLIIKLVETFDMRAFNVAKKYLRASSLSRKLINIFMNTFDTFVKYLRE